MIKNKGLLLIVFTALILTLFSCSSPEADWKDACQANSTASYKEFIKKHPSSSLADSAKNCIKKILMLENRLMLSSESALPVQNITSQVGKGSIKFKSGAETNKLLAVLYDVSWEIHNNKGCRYCAKHLVLEPNVSVPASIFSDETFPPGPPRSLGSHEYMRYDYDNNPIEGGVKGEVTQTISVQSNEKVFLIAGPEGAELEKTSRGFILQKGMAYLQNIPKELSE